MHRVATLALLALPATPALAQQVDPPAASSYAPPEGDDAPATQRLPASTAPDQSSATEITLGAAAWEGDFGGASKSHIAAVLLNVRKRFGDVRIEATLPWMRVRSPTTIFAGIDGTPLVLASAIPMTAQRRHGLGDLTLGAAWLALKQDEAGVNLDLSGKVKLPTAADSTGLSTQRTDYAFGAEVSRSFGRLTPIARVRYRIFGDPPGWNIRDGVSSSLGMAATLPGEAVLLVSYDFAQRTSRFISPSHEIVAGASAPVARSLRLTAYGSAGLSSGAAAVSAGVSLTLAI